MKPWIPILLLSALVACHKAPTKPVHDLSGFTGTHTGRYDELICALPQEVEYHRDSLTADLDILQEDLLSVRLFLDSTQDLWAMEAFYINDSTFYITPFTKDLATWSGNLRFTDSVRILLANRTSPCVLLGDTVATVVYVAGR